MTNSLHATFVLKPSANIPSSSCNAIKCLFSPVFLQNPLKLYKSLEHWFFTGVCVVWMAYGILSLTDAGSVSLRAKLLPVIFAPPLLHPVLSFFASPQAYLSAWGLESYRHFYEH